MTLTLKPILIKKSILIKKNNFDDIPVPLTPPALHLLIMTLGLSVFCTKMK